MRDFSFQNTYFMYNKKKKHTNKNSICRIRKKKTLIFMIYADFIFESTNFGYGIKSVPQKHLSLLYLIIITDATSFIRLSAFQNWKIYLLFF